MFDWMRAHEALLGWLGATSALLFVGSLVAVPWMVMRIPPDYFMHRRRTGHPLLRHPIVYLAWKIAKNLLGLVLVVAGIAMLVLPGQGILTILVGLMCLDFPGKFAMERRIARQSSVLATINWIRAKGERPPLELPQEPLRPK